MYWSYDLQRTANFGRIQSCKSFWQHKSLFEKDKAIKSIGKQDSSTFHRCCSPASFPNAAIRGFQDAGSFRFPGRLVPSKVPWQSHAMKCNRDDVYCLAGLTTEVEVEGTSTFSE